MAPGWRKGRRLGPGDCGPPRIDVLHRRWSSRMDALQRACRSERPGLHNLAARGGNRLHRRAPDAPQRAAQAAAPIRGACTTAATRRLAGAGGNYSSRPRNCEAPCLRHAASRPGHRSVIASGAQKASSHIRGSATAVDHAFLIRSHGATSCPRLSRASTSWSVPPRNLGSSRQGRRGWPGRSPAMTKQQPTGERESRGRTVRRFAKAPMRTSRQFGAIGFHRRAPDATQRAAVRRRSGALAPPPPRIGPGCKLRRPSRPRICEAPCLRHAASRPGHRKGPPHVRGGARPGTQKAVLSPRERPAASQTVSAPARRGNESPDLGDAPVGRAAGRGERPAGIC